MGHTKPVKLDHFCPNCEIQGFKSNVIEINWIGNHDCEQWVLETHCNQCGWSIDSEGKLRSPGKIFNFVERGN